MNDCWAARQDSRDPNSVLIDEPRTRSRTMSMIRRGVVDANPFLASLSTRDPGQDFVLDVVWQLQAHGIVVVKLITNVSGVGPGRLGAKGQASSGVVTVRG